MSTYDYIALMGPTASGKTDLALTLASACPVEIVSVDSAMVYRGLDIGTAKPEWAIRQAFPHALMDVCDPAEAYSVGQFIEEAEREMRRIHAAGKMPLLTGGTMLYFHLLMTQGGLDLPATDPAVRECVAAREAAEGLSALYAQLVAVDPAMARQLHPHDSQRIKRALELYVMTGESMSVLQARQKQSTAMRYRPYSIALLPADRAVLHARIAARFDSMCAMGWRDEVAGLMALPGFSAQWPLHKIVGYREMIAHLQGQLTADAMQSAILAGTRQLAKRQLTWLRKWPQLHAYAMGEAVHMRQLVEDVKGVLGC
jgi:tRNA dimethylallyltransferase